MDQFRRDVQLKLGKEQKDKELLKVIKEQRRPLYDKLMKDSVHSAGNKIEDRIEKVFDMVAEKQQKHLNMFFESVEATMTTLKDQISSVKQQS